MKSKNSIKKAKGTSIEAKMLIQWQKVLNRKKIDVDDDFFALGGSSLMAMQLASKINQEFYIVFPILEIFRNPTLKKLNKRVRAYIKKKK